MRFTCQQDLRAYVPACQRAKNVSPSYFYIPMSHKTSQCFNFACQRVNWCDNVPKDITMFQIFLLRNTKGGFYTLLLYKKLLHYTWYIIITTHSISVCNIHKNCIILNFYNSCHIKENCAENLFFETFLFFVGNENIERPSFYTLRVTRAFSHFPMLKQQNEMKNMYEYCSLPELRFGERRQL